MSNFYREFVRAGRKQLTLLRTELGSGLMVAAAAATEAVVASEEPTWAAGAATEVVVASVHL